MNIRIITTGLMIALGAVPCIAQTPVLPQKANEKWIGVWQGGLGGQPGVTITLAEQDGQLGGTAVFNIVLRQPQPHAIAGEPHILLATNHDGDTLHFQILAFQGRPALQYDMKATGADKVQLKCLNCGDSPEAELVRTAPVYPAKDQEKVK